MLKAQISALDCVILFLNILGLGGLVFLLQVRPDFEKLQLPILTRFTQPLPAFHGKKGCVVQTAVLDYVVTHLRYNQYRISSNLRRILMQAVF